MTERNEIADAIRSQLKAWGVSPEQARGVNEGECMVFVNELLLATDFDIERMTTNDLPSQYVADEDGFDAEPYHEWVTDGTYHYDAECPEGVDDWKKLPFFKRTLGLA